MKVVLVAGYAYLCRLCSICRKNLLLSALVSKLQDMLSLCFEFSSQWDLSFNCKNVKCWFDSMLSAPYKLALNNCTINWSVSFRYLGVIIQDSINLTVEVEFKRKKFLSMAYGYFAG